MCRLRYPTWSGYPSSTWSGLWSCKTGNGLLQITGCLCTVWSRVSHVPRPGHKKLTSSDANCTTFAFDKHLQTFVFWGSGYFITKQWYAIWWISVDEDTISYLLMVMKVEMALLLTTTMVMVMMMLQCSHTCGHGVQTRRVSCHRVNVFGWVDPEVSS